MQMKNFRLFEKFKFPPIDDISKLLEINTKIKNLDKVHFLTESVKALFFCSIFTQERSNYAN
ncbi:MAG: hypothetical protein DWQ06_08035 [Calditrichaeota bacterium]|nr:MAG: hypothetical protein DWQ06_08035 [Calditrichota bacterium]